MTISAPDAKTRAAASASAKMLNSAAGVALPCVALPPISEMPAMRRTQPGSRSMAKAMLVSGPSGTIQVSLLGASSRKPTASSLATCRSCAMRVTPPRPLSP